MQVSPAHRWLIFASGLGESSRPAKPPATNSVPSDDSLICALYALSSSTRVDPIFTPLAVEIVDDPGVIDQPVKRDCDDQTVSPSLQRAKSIRHSSFSTETGGGSPNTRPRESIDCFASPPKAIRREAPVLLLKIRKPSPSSATSQSAAASGATGASAWEPPAGACGAAGGVVGARTAAGGGWGKWLVGSGLLQEATTSTSRANRDFWRMPRAYRPMGSGAIACAT